MRSAALRCVMPSSGKQLPPDPTPLLFCPFCRECFEGPFANGPPRCPEHELDLVRFEDLPEEEASDGLPAPDEPVAPFDPRLGRGLVMLGTALSAVSFALPLVSMRSGERTGVWSAFEAAAREAPNLWTIPFVGAMFVWILARRRTPAQMRGARLVGILLAAAPLASLVYTVVKLRAGAAALTARGHETSIHVEHGAIAIALACVLLGLGSLRLGVPPASRSSGPLRRWGRRGRFRRRWR